MIEPETIYALSSGLGRAGIAVVRVSGPQAKFIVEAVAGSVPKPRLMGLRQLKSRDGLEVIDQALVLWMPGPSTVTGEDVAEFHVHGSPVVVSRLFVELAKFENVRPAEAGAFTRRAFENGRMDLLEVEGLADLLSANTDSQRRLAMRQFLGEASDVYESWRTQLLSALALLEASIDFVEEDDVVARAWKQVRPIVDNLVVELAAALDSASRAGAVRDGLRLVIAGPPNVGKSSLLNKLVGRDAAIVSALAGTTRDVVEAAIDFEGVALLLADTAGLRSETTDEIERIGMNKTSERLRDADIVVWVIAPDVADEVGPNRAVDLFVLNKADMLKPDSIHTRNDSFLAVSTRTGLGMTALFDQLREIVRARSFLGNQAIIVRDRHIVAVKETIRLLNESLKNEGRPLEVIAEDVRNAALALGSVTGRIGVEDLLGKIFSEFCIGK